MSEIDFVSSAKQGDIVEIGIEVLSFGNTSIALKCTVRNKLTHKTIIDVDKIVMVALDEYGMPKRHGETAVEYVSDRLKKED